MKTRLLFVSSVVLALFSGSVSAGQLYVDIYKTSQFSLSDIQPFLDDNKRSFDAIHDAIVHHDSKAGSRFEDTVGSKIAEEIKSKGKFAFLNFGVVAYINDPNTYLTINVVDQADANKLPVYQPKPKGRYRDPAHLIADWKKYEEVAMPLYMSGKVSSNMMECKEFHCLGTFGTPQLKRYEDKFNKMVPIYQDELVAILRGESDPKMRASAAFLLAHTTNENQLINWLLPSLDDPDESVRNSVARIMLAISMKDKSVTLPIDKFLPMLHSPILTDRNKALYVLANLAVQPRYVEIIKKSAGSDLIDNLKMYQPNLHFSAYQVLVTLSNQHYSDRDYAAWSHWLGLS
jgi:hypothetical protein